MRRRCEDCDRDGEPVEVVRPDEDQPTIRTLCLEHQATEVDLGALAVRTINHEP